MSYSRLDPTPIFKAHWAGFENGVYDGLTFRRVSTSRRERVATLAVPLVALLAALLARVLFNVRADRMAALGLSITWAALVMSGLLALFGWLASWRGSLRDRAKADHDANLLEAGLRALIDQTAAHILVGVMDCIGVAIFAVAAYLLPGWLSVISSSLVAGAWAHTLIIFLLVVSRSWAAYTRMLDVDAHAAGYERIF